jgi:hypothetical protein
MILSPPGHGQQPPPPRLTEAAVEVQRNPGNPMHLEPGRLRHLVDTALARQSYIICHDTLPYGRYPHAAPAVCRGFYNRYDTTALQLARQLWGFLHVPPPGHQAPPPGPCPTPPGSPGP